MPKHKRICIAIIVVFFTLVSLCWWFKDHMMAAVPPAISQGAILARAQILPGFSLVATTGERFTQQDLLGHWSVLLFGYSHCPVECGQQLDALTKAAHLLSLPSQQGGLQLYYVTIDPKRDNVAALQRYLQSHHANVVGLTGVPAELAKLHKPAGVIFKSQPSDDPEHYNFDLTTAILILDPQARWIGILRPPFTVQTLADGLTQTINYYNKRS